VHFDHELKHLSRKFVVIREGVEQFNQGFAPCDVACTEGRSGVGRRGAIMGTINIWRGNRVVITRGGDSAFMVMVVVGVVFTITIIG
jgi:hypothetical protein